SNSDAKARPQPRGQGICPLATVESPASQTVSGPSSAGVSSVLPVAPPASGALALAAASTPSPSTMGTSPGGRSETTGPAGLSAAEPSALASGADAGRLGPLGLPALASTAVVGAGSEDPQLPSQVPVTSASTK